MTTLRGDMEHQTCVSHLLALVDSTNNNDDILSHEMCHMWYGDCVTYGDWRDVWLSEGFATYGEAVYREYKDGPAAYHNYVTTQFLNRVIAAGPSGNDGVYDPSYLWGVVAYEKGASVLHMLRGVLDNDTLFFQALRDYRNAHLYGNAVTPDFIADVETTVGQDLSWFFDPWVYGDGHPVTVRLVMGPARRRAVEGRRGDPPDTDDADALRHALGLPCADRLGQLRLLAAHQPGEQTVSFVVPARPGLVIDPNDWVLASSTSRPRRWTTVRRRPRARPWRSRRRARARSRTLRRSVTTCRRAGAPTSPCTCRRSTGAIALRRGGGGGHAVDLVGPPRRCGQPCRRRVCTGCDWQRREGSWRGKSWWWTRVSLVVRRATHTVVVGTVPMGSAPIVVQSMTNTDRPTRRPRRLRWRSRRGGLGLVRITVNTREAAKAVPEIAARLADRGVPVIGDFHYNGHLLLTKYPACARALAKYRINPGNVGKGERHDENFATMVRVATDHAKPVRIGVNWGSLDGELLTSMMDENAQLPEPKDARDVTIDAMVESAVRSAERAMELGLPGEKIVLSVKMSRVPDLVDVYERLAARTDLPFHLGLTEAGMGSKGAASTAAALGILLQRGIGDTIRASLTPRPGGDRSEEVRLCQQVLQALGLRSFVPQVAACPGCGRTTSTVFQSLAEEIQAWLVAKMAEWKQTRPGVEELKVAVMGCIVNGPGESEARARGYLAAGHGRGRRGPGVRRRPQVATLQGETIAQDFAKIVEEYVEATGARPRRGAFDDFRSCPLTLFEQRALSGLERQLQPAQDLVHPALRCAALESVHPYAEPAHQLVDHGIDLALEGQVRVARAVEAGLLPERHLEEAGVGLAPAPHPLVQLGPRSQGVDEVRVVVQDRAVAHHHVARRDAGDLSCALRVQDPALRVERRAAVDRERAFARHLGDEMHAAVEPLEPRGKVVAKRGLADAVGADERDLHQGASE
jgi:(E)-4-hydroxy-3-methylbut-2-enyl-diphosphate synthase